MFKRFLLISILTLLLLPSIAFAVPGLPIVQCGTSTTADCTRCDLFKLLKNLIDFTVGVLMPAVAVLLFVWAGFLILLGGANPNLVTQGRTIFTNTFYGIIIMLSAWMITNTLIKSVGAQYDNADTWWQFRCVESAPIQPPVVQPPVEPPVDGEPAVCGQSWEQNLCQSRSMACGASACGQYVSAINQYAGRTGITNGANLLKAIMVKESTCNPNADSGHAYGVMQFKPATAILYASRCGVQNPSQTITPQWLKDNPVLSICIAAEYIKAISQSACGSSVRNIAAGYNGGEGANGACGLSVSCSGEASCDSSPKKKWECLYDNPQQNVCNTGFAETRDYATKVLYCYNNPGF